MGSAQCFIASGDIASALEVAQHTRAVFCCRQWAREHFNTMINEIVVMYRDASEIHRPAIPDDVSLVHGILSHYSFMMLSHGVCVCYARVESLVPSMLACPRARATVGDHL